MKVSIVAGTRPEAIKVAPVYHEFRRRNIDTYLISTGQHDEMLHQVLDLFDMKPDFELSAMQPNQDLSSLTGRLLDGFNRLFLSESFDYVFVQGDTTSAFIGSLLSFYHRIPVCHIEAGLRTGDMRNPFPEEANRKLIGCLTNFHFPPTKLAHKNLLNEGHPESNMLSVGNTVIDALYWVRDNRCDDLIDIRKKYNVDNRKYILMTMHRRESWGNKMRNVLKAARRYLLEHEELFLLFPLHLNPKVRTVVKEELSNLSNVILTEPLEYLEFVALMEGCHYIMTDSGGIQEEAPGFGKPTLVLREKTERPEAIESGTAILVGTDYDKVYHSMKLLEGDVYKRMSIANNPFGDGQAARRIVDFIVQL